MKPKDYLALDFVNSVLMYFVPQSRVMGISKANGNILNSIFNISALGF